MTLKSKAFTLWEVRDTSQLMNLRMCANMLNSFGNIRSHLDAQITVLWLKPTGWMLQKF